MDEGREWMRKVREGDKEGTLNLVLDLGGIFIVFYKSLCIFLGSGVEILPYICPYFPIQLFSEPL